MLTKITLDNFKSFKNTETIDLMKTNYTILPQNIADNGVLKGCIFVGANASGKSTIILGIKLLLDFLFSERNLNSGNTVQADSKAHCTGIAARDPDFRLWKRERQSPIQKACQSSCKVRDIPNAHFA